MNLTKLYKGTPQQSKALYKIFTKNQLFILFYKFLLF